jgi:hypothetical protein
MKECEGCREAATTISERLSRAGRSKMKSGDCSKAHSTNACARSWTVDDAVSSHAVIWLIGATTKETSLPAQLLQPHLVNFSTEIANLPFELPYLMLPCLASGPQLFLKLLNDHVWIVIRDCMLLVERGFCSERT